MTAYYAIDLTHTSSKDHFLLDHHRGRVPALISGHTLGAISIKTDMDVGEHVAASTRYLGARLASFGQVFDFQLTNIGGDVWIQSLTRDKLEQMNAPAILTYTYLAIDELTPGSIAGVVSSGVEAGVVGATVTVSKGGFSKSTTSGALGVFVIEDVPVDTGYAMVATKTGYVSDGAAGVEVTEDTETEQNMALVKHGSVVGVTMDQDSTPLGGLDVTLDLPGLGYHYEATSDAVTGEFEFPSVVPNVGYTLASTKALYVDASETINAVEGTETEQDLTLSEFGALNGTVTDETGNVSGGTVNVCAVDTTEPVLYTGTTGVDGTYSILNIAPDDYDVWFEAENHVSAKTDDVTITAATVETQDKVLGEYANYGGEITAAAGGAKLAGATIEFYSAYPGAPAYSATSAAVTGAWAIANIVPGTYQVKVTLATYVTQFVMDRAVAVNADIVNDNFALVLA